MSIYFYYFIFIIALISANTTFVINNKFLSKILIFIVATFTISFIGFRDILEYNFDGYITDTYRYTKEFFPNMNTLHEVFYGETSWKGDYLFFTLTFLIRSITDSPDIYLFLISLISVGILFYAYYRLSVKINKEKYFLFFILLLITTVTFYSLYANLIRQGFALSIVLLSITINKKILKYFLLLVAFLFHKSIISIVIAIIIVDIFKNKTKILNYSLYITTFFFLINFKKLIINLNFNNIFIERLIFYADSETRSYIIKLSLLLIIGIIIRIFYKKIKNDFLKQIINIYMINLLFVVLLKDIQIVSARLAYNSTILLPVLIPSIGLIIIKNKILKHFLYIAILTGTILSSIITITYSQSFKAIQFERIQTND